jgi:large subunit ribosomal protein L33
MREVITLQCGDCKNRNYTTSKNKKKHTERLETRKFCNTCRKHTAHKEVKYVSFRRGGFRRGKGHAGFELGESSNG